MPPSGRTRPTSRSPPASRAASSRLIEASERPGGFTGGEGGPTNTILKGISLGTLDEDSSPEDAAKFVATTVALGGAGKALSLGSKALKASRAGQAASKATTAAKAAPKAAAAKTATKVASKTPKPIKSAAATAKRAARSKPARVVGKGAKVTTAPVRAPLRVVGRNPGKAAAAVTLGPGAVQSARTGDPKHFGAAVKGTGKALVDPDTYKTTARVAPGLITAPIGMAANVGLSSYRAAQTAIPGGKHYSKSEITTPAKKAVVDEPVAFGKHMIETFGSGDEKRIERYLEEEAGLTPFIVAGIPGARAARRPIGKAIRKVPAVERGSKRKSVARDVARSNRQGRREVADVLEPAAKNLRAAKGSKRTFRGRTEKMEPKHAAPLVAAEGIKTPEHVQAVKKRLGDRPADVSDDLVTAHDVVDYLERNPSVLADKRFKRGVETIRRAQPDVETSVAKKYQSQALTHGVSLPKDRLPEDRAAVARLKDKALRRFYEKKVEERAHREFEADMKRVVKEKGLAEPVYTHHGDVLKRAAKTPVGSGVRGAAGRSAHKVDHRSKAVLDELGRADYSWEAFAQKSLIEPRMKREINRNTERFAEQETIEVPVNGKPRRVLTDKQINRAIAEGTIDPKKHAWLDAQTWKAAVLDPSIPKSSVDVFKESVQRNAERLYGESDAGVPSAKGPKYIVVDRVKAEEFLKQHRAREGQILPALQRGAGRAVLGYSPSWLVLQPIAESAQALAAVGPHNIAKGLKDYRKMSDAEKRRFDSAVGGGAGTGEVSKVGVDLMPEVSSATNIGRALQRSRWGRGIHGVLTGRYASSIDRRKGLAIRRAVAAGHLTREYSTFRRGLRGLARESDRLDKLTPEQRMARFAKDPELQKKLESYTDDVMGNWSALTDRERLASQVVFFYPFVRMSLSWVFHTYPKRHPIKASIQQFLAQQNANKVEETLMGDPSFFAQWASAPVYGGKKGEVTSLLPLQRIAPGSNALIEAVGEGKSPRDLLRATNPVISGIAAAVGAYDPLSGRSTLDRGEQQDYKSFLGNLAASAAQLPAPLRAIDTLTGRKGSRALQGRDETPTTALFDYLQGGGLKKTVRSHLLPLAPQNAARQRQMAQIGRLLERKYDRPEDYGTAIENMNRAAKKGDQSAAIDYARRTLLALNAEKELDYVYGRYGIKYPELKDAFKSGASAQLGTTQFDMNRKKIIQGLLDAGIRPPNVPPFRPRKAA